MPTFILCRICISSMIKNSLKQAFVEYQIITQKDIEAKQSLILAVTFSALPLIWESFLDFAKHLGKK